MLIAPRESTTTALQLVVGGIKIDRDPPNFVGGGAHNSHRRGVLVFAISRGRNTASYGQSFDRPHDFNSPSVIAVS